MNSLSGDSLGLGFFLESVLISSYLAKAATDPFKEMNKPAPCPPGVMPRSDGSCDYSSLPAPTPESTKPAYGGGGGGGGSSYKPPASTPVTAPPPAPVESEFPWKGVVAGVLAAGAVGIVVAKKKGYLKNADDEEC